MIGSTDTYVIKSFQDATWEELDGEFDAEMPATFAVISGRRYPWAA
ncbi:hypothetical protein [Streptomyces sp. NPDC048411]